MHIIDTYFQAMLDHRASDLHLASDSSPIVRIDGSLKLLDAPAFTDAQLQEMLHEVCPDGKWAQMEEEGDVDFGCEYAQKARFRANYYKESHGISAAFRIISSAVLSIEELGLPKVCQHFASLKSGLVLVTGPTGSGKSTTLAAIIDYANRTRQDHILTVEDPIEFKHESKLSLVSHREVGKHTKSFARALRGALREDPDIIMIGEMRDLETISLALEAASTGHLVFGTLHTPSAAKTIDRIIDVFPAEQQNHIQTMLAESLRGVIAQNLFKRIDQTGRISALEILMVDTAVATLIREGRTHQIPSAIETGMKKGNVPLDQAILEHLKAGRISVEEALEKCLYKKKFLPFVEAKREAWEDDALFSPTHELPVEEEGFVVSED